MVVPGITRIDGTSWSLPERTGVQAAVVAVEAALVTSVPMGTVCFDTHYSLSYCQCQSPWAQYVLTHTTRCLIGSVNRILLSCLEKLFTVKPAKRGHLGELARLSSLDRCSLYRGMR
jgi:hypothetical protein